MRLLLPLLLLFLTASASAATPNVLFVLIDDMGYADLTCYGEKRVHTDQVDRLAAEGIRFTQFYVNAPICSPSRTALMTGLIVIASDNGPEPGAGSPGPFRGHKGNLYEGGIREPFIVWGPGLLSKPAAGTVNDATVIAGVDVLPSVLTLAGAKPAAGALMDGQDMSATLLGKEKAIRTKPLFWLRPPDRPGPANDPFPDLAVREGEWKLLINEDGGNPQLYDLARDFGEKTNLAAQNAAVVARLKKSVLDWRKSLPVGRAPAAEEGPRGDLQNDPG